MIVLLPPSEAKSAGGEAGSVLDPASLAFPALTERRERVVSATERAARDAPPASTATRQRWIDDNAALRSSPVAPAIERYAGVLYDAIGHASLDAAARQWLAAHVVIGSALLGFVRAGDQVPSYKLAHSGLTGALRGVWRDAGAELGDDLVVDLRSKAYVQLAPVPGAVAVEVVGQDGAALNHWNKHGKGALVRALAEHRVRADSPAALADWAASAGVPLTATGDALRLVARPTGS